VIVSNLPADAHVHSEWSWDAGSDPASHGSMRRTCEHAVGIGLPAVIFTEHLDVSGEWLVEDGDIGHHGQKYVDPTGRVQLPEFDADGYLSAIENCRAEFPGLRILTGVEFGQPHLPNAIAERLIARGVIDRVNGSLHMVPVEDGVRTEPTTLYRSRPAEEVVHRYLDELLVMIESSDAFAVLCHIDYPARSWPIARVGPFDPRMFESGFRAAMRALAESGRALELNTRRLWPWIPQWWAEEGGRAITFGSDTHTHEQLAAHFPEAMAMANSHGFKPGPLPEDFWTR
jgi:histidinol-phosphatase (PHP family)